MTQETILDEIAILNDDRRFSLFKDYLSIEIEARRALLAQSKDWAEFKEAKGFIDGMSEAKDLMSKRLDDKQERDLL